MEFYSAIKNNTFESVLMRWVKLEPIIQSEVNQKEKHQYSILTHIHVILKDGNDTLYVRQQKRHSSVLAWRIPGMGKPGGLPSMGSHRV